MLGTKKRMLSSSKDLKQMCYLLEDSDHICRTRNILQSMRQSQVIVKTTTAVSVFRVNVLGSSKFSYFYRLPGDASFSISTLILGEKGSVSVF